MSKEEILQEIQRRAEEYKRKNVNIVHDDNVEYDEVWVVPVERSK